MAIDQPALPAQPAEAAIRPKRWIGRFNPKKALNGFASKALEAADVVLGSIPIAEVAAEIKDVALIAIKD